MKKHTRLVWRKSGGDLKIHSVTKEKEKNHYYSFTYKNIKFFFISLDGDIQGRQSYWDTLYIHTRQQYV